MRPAIIADDLTGACDAAARAALAGWQSRVLMDWECAAAGDLLVISTATRNQSPEQAARVVTEAGRELIDRGAQPVFKKIDSTLRGPWAAEVAALRLVTEAELVAVAPAFPECGRVVRGGVVYCDGEPVGALAPALATAGIGDALIGDAESDRDLAAFAESVRGQGRSPRRVLWVGSAGLARYAFGPVPSGHAPRPRPTAARWLVVAGSTHPSTLAQVDVLRQACLDVALAEVIDEVPGIIEPGVGLFFIGGDTAERAVRALSVSALDVFGEVLPGVAVGRLVGGRADGVPFLSKAGGFGAPDTVLRALEVCAQASL